ncbi:MAG: L,D-transpeptidase [Magnetococcales bacterium]|nr:L,D-transpeptidase [Magnetococcales bacterium]
MDPKIRQRAKSALLAAGWDGIKPALVVWGRDQLLELLTGQVAQRGAVWPISTGLAGFGNQQDSGCTPTGLHRISDCIGADAPLGTVFVGRQPTGEVLKPGSTPDGDFITTRILWLDGLEPGVNQGGAVDSRSRYIYIHGTPHTALLGQPVSAGCVRMSDMDIVSLFERVSEGTLVLMIAKNPEL